MDAALVAISPVSSHHALWLRLLQGIWSLPAHRGDIMLHGERQLRSACFVGYSLDERERCPEQNGTLLFVDPVVTAFGQLVGASPKFS
ncbi:unnamed protein product, partial [Polarella glacialis]